MRKRSNLFTIIELLIVIAVIAILAGMLFAAMKAINDKKDKSATKALILELSRGITKYESVNGEYPEHVAQCKSTKLYELLMTGDTVYCEIDDEFIKDGAFIDKWGNPIYYMTAPYYNKNESWGFTPDNPDTPINETWAAKMPLFYGENEQMTFYNSTTFQVRSLGKNGYDDRGDGDDIQNVKQ